MPEAQDIPGSDLPPTDPNSQTVRRRRRRPWLVRHWWVLPVGMSLVVAPLVWGLFSGVLAPKDSLPGYISDPSRLEAEYAHYVGRPLQDTPAMQRFDQATHFMLSGNYSNAAIVLEDVSKKIPVPAIFNDIGIVYAKMNDGPRAVRAFRDALARDHDYASVRGAIKRLNLPADIDPGASELEPNNSNLDANAIWLDHPLEANIEPSTGDVDCYWFIAPRPPRDRVSVQVLNRSTTLIPQLRVYDSDDKLVGGLREGSAPGESARLDFSPSASGFYRVQVTGRSGTSGDYTLAVNALHAFDLYEPNDDVLNTARIALGQTIEANIMDSNDSDYYSFVSPVAATLSIDITPRDNTLIPALTTFAPDLRSTGFGPDIDNPGARLHHTIKVEANQVYAIQVWGKSDTAGFYSLVVK